MVSRCLSATGIRFSVILFPPRSWALLAVGLPEHAYRHAPDLDRVTTFRTHELRPGWVPSVPRGRRCSSRTEARAQPAPAAPPRLVPKPRSGIPSSEASLHEASNEGSHRSPVRSSPRLWPPDGSGASWAFPRASHPAITRSARRGGDGSIEHGPETSSTASAEPPTSRVYSVCATSRRTREGSSVPAARADQPAPLRGRERNTHS